MKKTLIGFITATTIIAIVIMTNVDKSWSANSEEKLEMALVKSMKETKKVNEKINKVLRKTSQAFNKSGLHCIGWLRIK